MYEFDPRWPDDPRDDDPDRDLSRSRSAALYAVPNRRSAETPATLASAKSRAMSARMSSSSFFDVR